MRDGGRRYGFWSHGTSFHQSPTGVVFFDHGMEAIAFCSVRERQCEGQQEIFSPRLLEE